MADHFDMSFFDELNRTDSGRLPGLAIKVVGVARNKGFYEEDGAIIRDEDLLALYKAHHKNPLSGVGDKTIGAVERYLQHKGLLIGDRIVLGIERLLMSEDVETEPILERARDYLSDGSSKVELKVWYDDQGELSVLSLEKHMAERAVTLYRK